MDDELIGLSDLLKATMTAAIEADKEAADNYYKALKDYAYVKDKDDHGRSSTNKLDYFKLDIPNGNGELQEISIPKISMMPMPLLHITEAVFHIEGDMVLYESSESSGELNGNGVLKQSRIGVSVDKDTIVHQEPGGESSGKNVKTNLKITVKMEQSDLPAGLGVLLQTIANNTKIETK